jgi:hypothetical protein
MGEARRRIGRSPEGEIRGPAADVYADIAAYLLDGSADRMLLLGPVVWFPSDGTSARRWSFNVVGCSRTGEARHDQLNAETEAEALEFRAGLFAALVDHGSCLLQDLDDELHMARMAEAAWPGDKITRLRERIEAERMAWQASNLKG